MNMGKIRRTVVIAISVAALSLAFALPAAAHGGHTSCKGFADVTVGFAQGGWMDLGFDNPGWQPFTEVGPPGHEGPGAVAAWMEFEHELFCAPAE